MKMEPVTSSNIAAIGYDHTTKTLAVKFKSGDLWHYPGASPDHHRELMSAKSIGKHFHAHIKGRFEGKKQ
jgi:hypothetical protein